MDRTTLIGILKAVAACLAISGIQLSPDAQNSIIEGWIAIHAALSAIQAKFSKDK